MLGFFSEIGFLFPPFPYVVHSRGWAAEDMEQNIAYVAKSKELRDGAKALVKRSVEMAETLLGRRIPRERVARGGRKAHRLQLEEASHLE